MFKCFEEKAHWGFISMELATIVLAVIVFKVWRGARIWIVHDVNVWWFIAVFVIFAVKAYMYYGGLVRKSKRKNR